MHNSTNAPTGRSWPDVVLSDFELLLDSCLLHMEARYAKRAFAQYRSLKHHACSCTKSVSRCFSYVWSTTDMAHQENENLDQKLHLPKMQNSVPVQSFALGAVIKRINYLTFYLALQHKLLDTLQNISPLYENRRVGYWWRVDWVPYQLKQSVKVFHSLMLYLRLPERKIRINQPYKPCGTNRKSKKSYIHKS